MWPKLSHNSRFFVSTFQPSCLYPLNARNISYGMMLNSIAYFNITLNIFENNSSIILNAYIKYMKQPYLF